MADLPDNVLSTPLHKAEVGSAAGKQALAQRQPITMQNLIYGPAFPSNKTAYQSYAQGQ